jgi:VWFA-related protein
MRGVDPRDRRGRTLVATCLVALAAAAAALAQAPPSPAPQFRTGVDIVVVEATVHDRRGEVAEGLGPADFTVEIDGRPREIATVDLVRHASGAAGSVAQDADPDVATNRPAVTARTILIVIDHASLRVEGPSLIEPASRWLSTLGAGDRVGLMVLPLPGVNIEFTTDHARIREALAKVRPLAKAPPPFPQRTVSPWEAVRIGEGDTFVYQEVLVREKCAREPGCKEQVDMLARTLKMDGESAAISVLRSLRAVMKAMAALPGPKHAVLLSSGWLMTERDAAIEIDVVAADAAASNVTIHTFTSEDLVPTASQRRPSPTPSQDRNLLVSTVEMVSGMTGGRAVRMASKGDLAFASLTAGLGGYYRLGVRARPEDLDGRPHRISLKVTKSGTKLAGHRRVFAAAARTPAAPAAPVDPAKALRAALESPTPAVDLELTATSYVLHGTEAGSRTLRVVVAGDVARGSAGPASAVAALFELEGQPVTATEAPMVLAETGTTPVTVSLAAPPGVYTLRLAVRDVDGHVGSVERVVDATWKAAGPVETPGLVLMRAATAPGAAPQPVIQRVTTAEQVIAQVPFRVVAGDKPQVAFEVLAETGGAVVSQRAARIGIAAGGTSVAEAIVPAGSLPPGRYTLRATIRPGNAPPFTRAFVVEPAPR